MKFYTEIKNKLVENENYARIKDYSKEKYKVQTYFEIGKILSEAGKCYGENIIGKYAERLQKEVGRKYNQRTLRSMRQLYNTFNDDIWKPVVSKLTWTNLIILMTLKTKNELEYYAMQCIKLNLSKRELKERIKAREYERLNEETKLKLINKEELTIQDNIKNPIIISNKHNRKLLTERDLQNIILENIPEFLRELGNKFCFIDNEYKIKIGDSYNYIDLLLYNSEYHCSVVVELKITELRKEYIGQVETYMNYVDMNMKSVIDGETIGIIICKKDNMFLMEYCSDSRILSRYYEVK